MSKIDTQNRSITGFLTLYLQNIKILKNLSQKNFKFFKTYAGFVKLFLTKVTNFGTPGISKNLQENPNEKCSFLGTF